MDTYLPFIIIGITTGAVYGLEAVGLVLTYKTTGIFNFAQGAVSSIAVFVFFVLVVQHQVPWPIAAVVSVLIIGPLCGLALERIAQSLIGLSTVYQITAMLGVMLIVLAVGDIWFGSTSTTFPVYLPVQTIGILGTQVSVSEIIVLVISIGCTAGLYYFFRAARLGVAMRGLVDDADLVAMTGRSPVRLRRIAWVLGSTFAALAGILIAPTQNVNGIVLTLLLVQAFGAAALGFFSSLPLTYLGGLFIGVAAALSTKLVGSNIALSSLPVGIPFIALFLALILVPRSRFRDRRFTRSRTVLTEWHAPTRVRILAGVVTVVLLAFIPGVVGAQLPAFTQGLATILLVLSLGLLVRTSGQISLCQYAFAAIGAVSIAHFTSGAGIPWGIALVLAGLVAVPVGALIAIPAIRVSGVFLALATFGFGLILEQVCYSMNWMFGAEIEGLSAPRPTGSIGPIHFSTNNGYYYLCLAITALITVAVVCLLSGRLGRLLKGLSDSPVGLETNGASVSRLRVLVFCVSAFIASIAGALTASLFTFATASSYPSFGSLTLAALLTMVLFGTPWYAIAGAAGIAVVPAYLNFGNAVNYLNILFGLFAIAAPLTVTSYKGAPAAVRRGADWLDAHMRIFNQRRLEQAPENPGVAEGGDRGRKLAALRPVLVAGKGTGLEVRGLRVEYGGVLAVRDLALKARPGSITGLIGPNGAGKTTTFNACSGLARPTQGRVFLNGTDVTSLSASARARRGIGRTFQRPELFDSLTTRQNIELGRESGMAGSRFLRQIFPKGGDKAAVGQSSQLAAEFTGVADLAGKPASELTTGQRRLVELTRVLAGPFDMLLLDEPSAGLDSDEVARLASLLKSAARDLGLGILLVEHDMELVSKTCDYVYVLDFGALIFEGSVPEMHVSEVVQKAYLGRGLETVALSDETSG